MFRFSGDGFITNLKADSNLMESFDNVTKILTLWLTIKKGQFLFHIF